VNKKTFFFILLFGFFAFLVFNFPDFWAWYKTPPFYVFTGQASYFDPADINNYLAIINYSQKNKLILAKNLYLTQETKPIFIYFIYSFAGYFLKLSPIKIFYLLRFLSTIFLVFVLWFLINFWLTKTVDKIFALFGIVFGGGLGWLFGKRFIGADVFIGSFTFYEPFTKPHEGLALGFYVLSLTFFIALS